MAETLANLQRGGNSGVAVMFSDGSIEYFEQSKYKKGSTTTRPYIPLTATVTLSHTKNQNGNSSSTVTFNKVEVCTYSISSNGSGGSSAVNVDLAKVCANSDELKSASWAITPTTLYNATHSYKVTYTSWIEEQEET